MESLLKGLSIFLSSLFEGEAGRGKFFSGSAAHSLKSNPLFISPFVRGRKLGEFLPTCCLFSPTL